VACSRCLTRDGAPRTLAGERFARYLWRPGTGIVEAHEVSMCETCGTEFEHEPIAVALTEHEVRS
jgi:hypothetical protein